MEQENKNTNAADTAALDNKAIADKAAEDKAIADKVAEDKAASKGKTKKVKFLISPTGKFNLAYCEGEKASLPEAQAIELEEAGYVKFIK